MESRIERNAGPRRLTVLLVDDHPAIRAAIRNELEMRHDGVTVGEAGTIAAARVLMSRSRPDVLVFDIELPDGSGIDLLADHGSQSPMKCVCVSMHIDRKHILEALSRGANGYVSKDSHPAEIAAAVEEVHSGRSYLCPRAAHALIDWIQTTPDIAETGLDPRYRRLSPKEKEVFRLLSLGYDTPGIAEFLSTSKKTISNYRSTVLSSLGVRSVRELIVFAEENGIR